MTSILAANPAGAPRHSARKPPGTATIRLVRREPLAEGVVRLTFEDPDGCRLPPWTPGSHIDLILPTGAVRHYSLCGDRWDGFRYQVAVLREQDGRGGSAWIHDHAREGDLFDFGGPRNHFPLVPATEYLFVAGGIGITPLMPMIDQARRTSTSWRLLYGGRRRSTMAFAAEFASRYPNQVTLAPHDEVGLPDIAAWLGAPEAGTRVYTCGPVGLLDAVQNACEGWPSHYLHSEQFVARPQAGAADRPFELDLWRSGRALQVAAGQSILDALNVAGVSVLSSCHQGTCGTCELGVIEGTPDHRDSVLNEHDRAAGDCIISCVSRAAGDRLVLDI